MTTVTKYVKTAANGVRECAESIGDTAGMVRLPSYQTVIGDRPAVVTEWYNEQTFDGWEQTVITLHDWEV